MRSQTYTVSASAAGNAHSAIFIPDTNISSFLVGFGAKIATTAHYTIQHTFDNPLDPPARGLAWFPKLETIATAADAQGSYVFPVGGIRVEISAASEGGVSVTFLQSGMGY